jgi:esterase/lipase superfamily enzyme
VGEAPPPGSTYSLIKLFFATNRAQKPGGNSEGHFANAPGPLVYGSLSVSVPFDHHFGTIERPGPITGIFFGPDPDKHFTIQTLQLTSRQTMLDAIAAQMAGRAPAGRVALVFIHGFNVAFDDAAFRTAQMAADIGFTGVPVFYSWPSEHSISPLGYTHDATRIEESRPLIKQFISDIITRSRADHVIIIAHSMGTRGVTRVLAELSAEHPEQTRRIAALILAAPDISGEIFRNDIAPRLSRMAASVTLYASSEDKALEVSHIVNGAYALGDARAGIRVLPGMDSIDATLVGTSFLGHSTYGESPRLLEDIKSVVAGRRPPARAWLSPRTSAAGAYYVFTPAP